MSNLCLQVVNQGDPLAKETMQLVKLPIPTPGADEVLFKVKHAAINPSDTLAVRGLYKDWQDTNPTLPATLGFECSGIVESVGTNVTHVKAGQNVSCLLIGTGGAWAEYAVTNKAYVHPLPEGMAMEKAAQLQINPMTVAAMFKVLGIKAGDYFLQTGGNSACGMMAIQIAKARGIKTINIVRRADGVEPLKKLGADHVIASNDVKDITGKIMEITGGKGVDHFIDQAGGDVSAQCINSVKKYGNVIIYGRMSDDTTPIDNLVVLFNRLNIIGFHVATWCERFPDQVGPLVTEVSEMIMNSQLSVPVQESYGLTDWRKAFEAQIHNVKSRSGKIQFDMSKNSK